ncbi:MAG: glutamate racemase [Clostridiales bacterium]|nr:glutamate racemase [Clostridiales bacterium]
MGKIVVFDSGFGGLTVLKELVTLMPDEEYIYYGDSANAPYGEKSHDELLKLGSDICLALSSEYDVKCFVIACNTTTSEVWNELTERFGDYSFVGIEPALAWAAEENPGRNILVLATTATINGKRLRHRYELLKDKANITLLPAPGIVPFVENKDADPEEFAEYMDKLLAPYKDAVDCVVLGCTHFPFVKNEILTAIGHNILFYDAAVSVAETVRRLINGELQDKERSVFHCGTHIGTHSRIHSGTHSSIHCGMYSGMNSGMNSSDHSDMHSSNLCGNAAAGEASEKKRNIIFLNSDPAKLVQEKTLFDMYRCMSINS